MTYTHSLIVTLLLSIFCSAAQAQIAVPTIAAESTVPTVSPSPTVRQEDVPPPVPEPKADKAQEKLIRFGYGIGYVTGGEAKFGSISASVGGTSLSGAYSFELDGAFQIFGKAMMISTHAWGFQAG